MMHTDTSKAGYHVRIHNSGKVHRYECETLSKAGAFGTVSVDANTRTQAAKICASEGYQVRSVNMVA